jgi:hypothetical protein
VKGATQAVARRGEGHLRAQRRRRLIRKTRRRAINALFGLAQRTERTPGVARALRAAARRLERLAKRLEEAVAPRPGRPLTIAVGWDEPDAAQEHRALLALRVKRLVRVDQPLVLITQMPRSGGTLLMRLFDGHPECHAIPHELRRLLPSKLPLPRDPSRAWKRLADPLLAQWFGEGARQAKGSLNEDRSRHEFLLPPLLHRALFEHCIHEVEPKTDRAVLDCYLTSYFNAWLDYRGLRTAGERLWVTGFEPAAITDATRLRCFRELYPDGRLVSVVRDPASWLASAARRNPRYADRDLAMGLWQEAIEAALRVKEENPDSVAIVPFESLVGETEATMRAVADFLGIALTSDLVVPTFNGAPVKANSSFRVERAGLIDAPLTRREELPRETVEAVVRKLGSLHARALEVALGPATPVGR